MALAVSDESSPLDRLTAELCDVEPPGRTAARAEIVTLLHFGGGVTDGEAGLELTAAPATAAATHRLAKLMDEFGGVTAPTLPATVRSGSTTVRVSARDAARVALGLGLIDRFAVPVVGLPPWLVAGGAKEPAIAAAALRGGVLSAGRLTTNHMRGVALTIACPGFPAALALRGVSRHVGAGALLGESAIGAVTRHWVTLRSRDGLAAALTAMGAADRTARELDPGVERRRPAHASGLRDANRERARRASAATVEAVRALVDRVGDNLPPELAAVAFARMEFPEDSLEELGLRCGISKNAVSYRLRKVQKIAKECTR